jgi:hypothetical protein
MTIKNHTEESETDKERAGNVVTEMLKSGWATVVGWVIVMAIAYGVITTNQKWNEQRFMDNEIHVNKNEARIALMEHTGNPDQERRLTKVEIRTDNLDQKFAEMNAKLDTTIAILSRCEVQLNALTKTK